MAVLLSNESSQAIHHDATVTSGYVYAMCSIAALGGILFGFDMVIISGAVPFFVEAFKLTQNWGAVKTTGAGCLLPRPFHPFYFWRDWQSYLKARGG